MVTVFQQFIDGMRQTGLLEYVAVISGLASVWYSKKEDILQGTTLWGRPRLQARAAGPSLGSQARWCCIRHTPAVLRGGIAASNADVVPARPMVTHARCCGQRTSAAAISINTVGSFM